MVFRPSLTEMKDFAAYVRFMESVGAAKQGVAKVRPQKQLSRVHVSVGALGVDRL